VVAPVLGVPVTASEPPHAATIGTAAQAASPQMRFLRL